MRFDPFDPEFLNNPYPTYAKLRRDEPVHFHSGGLIFISRHADVTFALNHPELFSSTVLRGRGDRGPIGALIGDDPPLHTRRRRIANRALSPRRVTALRQIVRDRSQMLLSAIEPGSQWDLVGDYARSLPAWIIADLTGIPAERVTDLKRWSNALVLDTTGRAAGGWEQTWQTIEEFRTYLRELIDERRDSTGDDLISTLIGRNSKRNDLEPEAVVDLVTLFVAAGSETTTHLVANAMVALLSHPDQWERLCRNPEWIPAVVEETLRFDAPLQSLVRGVREDIEIAGRVVPKGRVAVLLLGSANRDEARFADPDDFNPDRVAGGQLAFGTGPHHCPGAALARLEAETALAQLSTRFPKLHLSDQPLEYEPSLLVRGPRAVPVAG